MGGIRRLLAVSVSLVASLVCPERIFESSTTAAADAIDPKLFQQPYNDALVKPINEYVEGATLVASGGGVFWQRELSQSDTRYIQFYFDSISSPAGLDYTLRVLRDPAGQRVAVYTAAEFGRGADFITGMLPAGRLRIQLVSKEKPVGFSFRLVHALWQARPGEPATPQSFVATWNPVRTALPPDSPGAVSAKAVAMLHVGPLEASCTGVLIDPATVATNYHCVLNSLSFQKSENAERPRCDDIFAEFEYFEVGAPGIVTRCLAVRVDKQLDVALLTVDPQTIRDTAGRPRVPIATRPVLEGLPAKVVIMHHPLGLPMVIDQACSLRGSSATDILHDCATTSGSSGSPVLDEQMRWVGLHYKGPYPSNWTVEMIETDAKVNGPRYNQARVSAAVSQFLLANSQPR
jgi:hypothetical protein